MKHPFKNLSALFVLAGNFAAAQQGHMAAGGDASGSSGSVSYSYGQVVYTTVAGNIIITQGIQQPYEVTVLTDHTNNYKLSFDLVTYPNPTPDFLTIQLSGSTLSGVNYQLYDVNGRLLVTRPAEAGETTLSLLDYARGIYLLKLTQGTEEIKTYKIIKN